MSIIQYPPVVPPQLTDSSLRDFAQVVQLSLATLFQAGHVHKIVLTNPAPNIGNIGDIYLVDGVTKSIVVKFKSGWFSIGPLTAL